MKQIKCPFDGTPCQSDCIDRFPHRLEGGCRLTDHLAAGMPVLVINKPTAWGNLCALFEWGQYYES